MSEWGYDSYITNKYEIEDSSLSGIFCCVSLYTVTNASEVRIVSVFSLKQSKKILLDN